MRSKQSIQFDECRASLAVEFGYPQKHTMIELLNEKITRALADGDESVRKEMLDLRHRVLEHPDSFLMPAMIRRVAALEKELEEFQAAHHALLQKQQPIEDALHHKVFGCWESGAATAKEEARHATV